MDTKFLLPMHLIPFVSVGIFYPLLALFMENMHLLTTDKMGLVGPFVQCIVSILFIINSIGILGAAYLSICKSPIFISALCHFCGAILFLKLLTQLLGTLTAFERVWIQFNSCYLPYVVGLFGGIVLFALVHRIHKRGLDVWMHR